MLRLLRCLKCRRTIGQTNGRTLTMRHLTIDRKIRLRCTCGKSVTWIPTATVDSGGGERHNTGDN